MSKKLPKEAIAFAKSMGLDLNGLEVEAQVKNFCCCFHILIPQYQLHTSQ